MIKLKIEYKDKGHIYGEPSYITFRLYNNRTLVLKYKLVFSKAYLYENAIEDIVLTYEDKNCYTTWGFTIRVKDLIENVLRDIIDTSRKLKCSRLVIEFNEESQHIVDYLRTIL